MNYTGLDPSGNVVSNGSVGGGGGSGLTWFSSLGTYWTTSSDTARWAMAIVIRQMATATFDQLTASYTMPYAGALRQVTVTQNGGTSAPGNIILQRSTNNGASFSDWITLNGLVAAVGTYNANVKKYGQSDAVAQLNAGDIVIPLIQYTATGVNQSTTCKLDFACPGVS